METGWRADPRAKILGDVARGENAETAGLTADLAPLAVGLLVAAGGLRYGQAGEVYSSS